MRIGAVLERNCANSAVLRNCAIPPYRGLELANCATLETRRNPHVLSLQSVGFCAIRFLSGVGAELRNQPPTVGLHTSLYAWLGWSANRFRSILNNVLQSANANGNCAEQSPRGLACPR